MNKEGLEYLRDKIINFVGAKIPDKKECNHNFNIYIEGIIPRVMCKKCHKTIYYHELREKVTEVMK